MHVFLLLLQMLSPHDLLQGLGVKKSKLNLLVRPKLSVMGRPMRQLLRLPSLHFPSLSVPLEASTQPQMIGDFASASDCPGAPELLLSQLTLPVGGDLAGSELTEACRYLRQVPCPFPISS